MGSTRLPGKVLMALAGKPMIYHCVDRLLQVQLAKVLVVAIPDDQENDILEKKLAEYPVEVFRGSESDVLDRYYKCAQKYSMDQIIRATGDNPFVDPEEADLLIQDHLNGDYDYSCCFPEFGGKLPTGVGVEIFKFSALETSWYQGKMPHHREHVNEYIQENVSIFKVNYFPGSNSFRLPEKSLTVDTVEDFKQAEKILNTATGFQDSVDHKTIPSES
jgi:spore coat polysaccharide biosynthesis protein SpsF